MPFAWSDNWWAFAVGRKDSFSQFSWIVNLVGVFSDWCRLMQVGLCPSQGIAHLLLLTGPGSHVGDQRESWFRWLPPPANKARNLHGACRIGF